VPAMVRLSKPAHCGDTAFTDKTGGCNSKADNSGNDVCSSAER
jgi:hypothetical protein